MAAPGPRTPGPRTPGPRTPGPRAPGPLAPGPRTPGALAPGQTRDALLAEVRLHLGALPDGVTVVVACSGGPDSTALAFLAAEARPDLALTLVHVSHGWRDDTADAALVAEHAGWLGCEVVHRSIDAPEQAASGGGGPEAVARTLRYRLLREEAAARDAATILVGHSAEDQAETLLLRLARGTGPTGLAGMAVVSGDLTRPLLRVRRADLRRYVTLEGLPVADDPTNADTDVRRVRVRQAVLPALAGVGPDPVAALARLADLQRDDLDALEQAATSLAAQAVRWFGDLAVLDREALAAAPRAVASRVVRQVLQRWLEPAPPAAVVAGLLDARSGHGVTLPGRLQAAADTRWLTVERARAEATVREVQVPGPTPWPAIGAVLHARTAEEGPPPDQLADDAAEAQLGFDLEAAGGSGVAPAWRPPRVTLDRRLVPPGGAVERLRLLLPALDGASLHVRTAAPGDRLETGGGARRVVALYADAHLPRALRARWPVVTLDDRPVWTPGLAADEALLQAGQQAPAISLHLGASADRD